MRAPTSTEARTSRTPSTNRRSSQLGVATRRGAGDGGAGGSDVGGSGVLTADILPDESGNGSAARIGLWMTAEPRAPDLPHSSPRTPAVRTVHCPKGAPQTMAAEPRFLTLADVAEILNISTSQAYALVRNQELEAIKIGGRGQWRVERDRLEAYIDQMYDQTRQFLDEHPFVESDEDAPDGVARTE